MINEIRGKLEWVDETHSDVRFVPNEQGFQVLYQAHGTTFPQIRIEGQPPVYEKGGEIKVGWFAQLKSGGPIMTIGGIEQRFGECRMINCFWFIDGSILPVLPSIEHVGFPFSREFPESILNIFETNPKYGRPNE